MGLLPAASRVAELWVTGGINRVGGVRWGGVGTLKAATEPRRGRGGARSVVGVGCWWPLMCYRKGRVSMLRALRVTE